MFLRQSTIQTIRFGPFLDITDGVTEEVALTITQALRRLSKDGAAFAQTGTTGNATHDSDGWYSADLSAADTGTVGELILNVQIPATALPVWVRWWVIEETVYDRLYGAAAGGYLQATTPANTLDVTATGEAGLDFANIAGTLDAANIGANALTSAKIATNAIGSAQLAATAVDEIVDQTWNEDATAHQTLGTFGQAIGDPVANTKTLYAALVTDAVGVSITADVATVQADTDNIQTRLPAALVGGAMDSDVSVLQANVITAASINAAAITAAKFAAGAIDAAAIANGAIDAATFAAGAIDAAALAADAVSEIRSLVTGTTTSVGTTTTFVDTARTEIDDTWIGSWVLFTSGTETNRVRLITEFVAATDTATFAPAVSAAVASGVTYEILPAGGVDVQSWLGTESALVAPNALIAGSVDSDVSALQANTITAAAIANGAIDAATFAAGAIDATAIAAGAIDAATFAAGAIDAAAIANGAIDAATFAAGAIDAAAIATDAIDADALAVSAIDEIRDGLLPTQNAAFNNIEYLWVAASDHVTPVTAASTTAVTRSIDGAAFASATGTLAEVGNGIYQFDASAADMNGGIITFRFTATGGTPGAPDDAFLTIITGGGV